MSDDAEKRARARASWPIAKYELGKEPSEDLSATTTAEERLAMMWPLARDGWLMSGRTIPTYERKDAPGRLFRRPPRKG